MKNKPIIFSVLSSLCIVEPLIKVLYFKALTHFDFLVIFANISARNSFREVFDFWLVFPIAGLLILKLRKWTYFCFMSLLAYIVYNISTYERYTWPYNSDSPFMYHYLISLLCVGTFVYFLSPKVREPFFDRRVRWWEPKSRYHVQIMGKLQGSHLTFPTQILNISQSGAFLEDSKYLNTGDSLVLHFVFFGQMIDVPVEVIHRHTTNGKVGYGVKFKYKTFAQSIQMAKVIKVLRHSQKVFKEENNNLKVVA
jgi:hypothetical protein